MFALLSPQMGLDWPGAWTHLEQHSLSPFPAGKGGMKPRTQSRRGPRARCLQGKLRNGCICRLHHHLLPQGWNRRRQGAGHQETSEEQEPKGTKARCAQKLERLKWRDTFEQRWETLRSKNFIHSILLGNVITLFFYLSFHTYLKVWVSTRVCVGGCFWSVKSIPQASHHLFSNYLF